MAHTQTINESAPLGTDAASGGAAEFRNLKRDIRERMELEHYWNDSIAVDNQQDGKHINITIGGTGVIANKAALAVTGFSLTGANAQSVIDLAGTWNTSGTPTGIKLNITDTASNAASLLLDLQVGGVSKFSVSKTGVASAPTGFTGDIVLTSATPAIRRDTADGADTGSISLVGGGANAVARGAIINVAGNESGGGVAGSIRIFMGDAGTSAFNVFRGTDSALTFGITNAGAATFAHALTASSTFTASGLITANNGITVAAAGLTVSAGTTTLASLLDLSGASAGQIKFPASQNASTNVNTIDDYEEGSWTPVLGGAGGTSGQSYTSQHGEYVKIAKLVFISATITLSNKGTITGDLQLQGLPFTSDSSHDSAGTFGDFEPTAAVNNSWISGIIGSSATVVGIRSKEQDASTTMGPMDTNDVVNTTALEFMAMYRASA